VERRKQSLKIGSTGHRALNLRIPALTGLASTGVLAQVPFPFRNQKVAAEERIRDLVGRRTLEETMDARSTRPNVPCLGGVGPGYVEGLDGLALGGPGGWEGKDQVVTRTTQFQQNRCLGESWDPELIQKAAAREARETDYAFGKYHRHRGRAPSIDLGRDPGWAWSVVRHRIDGPGRHISLQHPAKQMVEVEGDATSAHVRVKATLCL
jgi:hypothetical protein